MATLETDIETPNIDFETALGRVVKRSKKSIRDIGNSRAFLVAVYGWPKHGKTYLMTRIQERFKKDSSGIDVSRCGGAPSESDFQNLATQEREVANLPTVKVWIVLYHCGWEKGPNYLRRRDDPNALAQKVLGRTMDLNVWIYNPKISNGSPHGRVRLDYSKSGFCRKRSDPGVVAPRRRKR